MEICPIKYQTSPNIALIKYWGKSDKNQNHALNSSLSLTLDIADISTITTIKFDPEENAKFTLNNNQTDIPERLKYLLSYLKQIPIPGYTPRPSNPKNPINIKNEDLANFNIVSENNFPTSSGLASSASAYAAIALCFGEFYKMSVFEIKTLARLGSGSATRSIEGGVNLWEKNGVGNQIDVNGAEKEISVFILQSNPDEKKVKSTQGMQDSCSGPGKSRLLKERLVNIEQDLVKMVENFRRRDWNPFMEGIMRDSNNFHSICMDTFPPIMYLDDFSKEVIQLVHQINEKSKIKMAYTFDAGPHAFLIVHNSVSQDIFMLIYKYYGLSKQFLNPNAQEFLQEGYQFQNQQFNEILQNKPKNKPSFVIKTKVGDGPQRL